MNRVSLIASACWAYAGPTSSLQETRQPAADGTISYLTLLTGFSSVSNGYDRPRDRAIKLQASRQFAGDGTMSSLTRAMAVHICPTDGRGRRIMLPMTDVVS